MPESPREWECAVCYANGKRTGEVKLRCGHHICVSCFMGIVSISNHYSNDYMDCPMCRERIPVRDAPNKKTSQVLYTWANEISMLRLTLKTKEGEVNPSAQKNLDDALTKFKKMCDDWDIWKPFEAMTHEPPWTHAYGDLIDQYGKDVKCWCGVGWRPKI